MTAVTVKHAPAPVILTDYIGPTDNKPGRVRAVSGSGKRIFVDWSHDRDIFQNHAAAAAALVAKLEAESRGGWSGHLVGGCKHGDGYAFVLVRE